MDHPPALLETFKFSPFSSIFPLLCYHVSLRKGLVRFITTILDGFPQFNVCVCVCKCTQAGKHKYKEAWHSPVHPSLNGHTLSLFNPSLDIHYLLISSLHAVVFVVLCYEKPSLHHTSTVASRSLSLLSLQCLSYRISAWLIYLPRPSSHSLSCLPLVPEIALEGLVDFFFINCEDIVF